MAKRVIALILVLILFLPLCGTAENELWTCPNCGQEGNYGNFCTNCGAKKPAAEWTCPTCGQEGNTGKFCSNCATARPAEPTGYAEAKATEVPVNEELEQIPGETDRVKVIVYRVDATSFIANKKDPGRWRPENAADGNETTCWQFSAKKGLKGKTRIDLTFDSPQTVDEIWFKNGFWAVNDKGKDQYPLNARLKDVRIEFLYDNEQKARDPVELTLKDESRNGWQRFSLGKHENVRMVSVAVVSVYKGSSFPNDVCLSEVMPVQISPAEMARPAQEEQTAVVYESDPSITGCNLTQKLATRSGPGTEYAEPGTFFSKNWQNQTVKVLKKSYDGSVWWVQVDFQNGSKSKYRVWTGAKRVDVDLNRVKEDKRICDCDIYPTSDTWFGPGGKYAKANISINRSAFGRIMGKENGYVDVEYWYEDDGFDGSHRVWIPESAVYNLYYGDYSGES
jgi:hypothetical protein